MDILKYICFEGWVNKIEIEQWFWGEPSPRVLGTPIFGQGKEVLQ